MTGHINRPASLHEEIGVGTEYGSTEMIPPLRGLILRQGNISLYSKKFKNRGILTFNP